MDLSLFNIEVIIKTAGYAGIFGIIFVESGFFFGIFLPGDSLLFTAGFLASQGYLNIYILSILCFFAAVLGDNFGYALGKKFGSRVFSREDSFFFNKQHLLRAFNFYDRHGGLAVVLARFVPVVRSFAPALAGVGKMKYSTFAFYNILGGILWTFGLTWFGYFLGNVIPDADRYILPIILGIIALSLLPGIVSFLKNKELRRQAGTFLKSLFFKK
jgi:membrane-associated protein